MAAPRSHSSLAALLNLPSELRECIAESMRRDAKAQCVRPTDPPADPSRVSMTAHLREVLVERGLLPQWRRHFEDSRNHFAPRQRPMEASIEDSVPIRVALSAAVPA